MGAETAEIPPETLALYEALAATCPGLERRGRAMPYTAVNGNMFSFLTPTGTLALRRPAKDGKPSCPNTTRPSASYTGA